MEIDIAELAGACGKAAIEALAEIMTRADRQWPAFAENLLQLHRLGERGAPC